MDERNHYDLAEPHDVRKARMRRNRLLIGVVVLLLAGGAVLAWVL